MATVDWKGYTWTLRDGGTGGPGFGGWSDDNVTGPDANGYLTMKITNAGSDPIGCQIAMSESLGYGRYVLVVEHDFSTLDKNIVFGGLFPFYYGNPYVEFDVCEISSWDNSDPDGFGAGVPFIQHNSWYGSDPDNPTLGGHNAAVIDSGTVHTFVFTWAPDMAIYDAFIGTGTSGTNILHTVHTSNIPVPGNEAPLINLWLVNRNGAVNAGDLDAPATNIVLRDFGFTALSTLLSFNLSSDFVASTTASGITTGAITDKSASLSSFTRGPAGYSSGNICSAGPASGATNAATAVSTNSYFFTTINPLAGKQMSLTTLTIDMARGGAATPRGYVARSSVDNYTANLATANLTAQRPTFQTITVDLSDEDFQNVTSPITFRIYVYAPSTVNVVDWDTLTINGTVTDAGTVEQEDFRFRADDGSETTATWTSSPA
jgi:hypothetical protein